MLSETKSANFSRYITLFVITLLAFSSIVCKKTKNRADKTGGAPAIEQPESHKKMMAILAEVNKKMNHPKNDYASDTQLAYYDSLMAVTQNPGEQVNLAFQTGLALLASGQEVDAVACYEQLLAAMKGLPGGATAVKEHLGVAYLRLGERRNCNNMHVAESCIMPIQGQGIHQDKEPSRKAIAVFEEVLKDDPQNFDVLWLLNIAYMTLGEYPQKVPAKWLISGLDQPGNTTVKGFTDLAPDLKLNVDNRGGSCIVDDFNNDGFLDVVSSAWGLDDPIRYFQNNGDGTFSDRSKASGIYDITGGLNLIQADYNNDGWLDIFVLRGAWQGVSGFGEHPNSLLRNNGNGTFSDITIDAGLLSYHPTQAGVWCDLNKDGWLDLFIGNETTDANDPHPCELYMNNKNGTFTNVAQSTGLDITAFVKGVVAGDYDKDGWPDLFLSTMQDEKFLFRHKGLANGLPVFENTTATAGITGKLSRTFPTFFFDYDNDGWLDLFMCNYEFDRALSYYVAKEARRPSRNMAGKIYLFHNNGNGAFTNVSAKMDINQTVFGMGGNFGDIDNDGWLDIYLGTGNPNYKSLVPNRMYKNMEGKDFKDVTVSSRLGNLQKGHGIAFADINNNGDQDIFIEMGGAYRGDHYPSSLYLNPGQSDNNCLYMLLEGVQTNRSAIGATITLRFTDGGKQRTLYREVNSGGSFGASPLRREIGVGKATTIDEIEIYWPVSGQKQVLRNIDANQYIKITEGKGGFEKLQLKTLEFKKLDGTIPMCAPRKLS